MSAAWRPNGRSGWHDAGDYNKYVWKDSATALYFLLSRPDYAFEVSPAKEDIYYFGCRMPKGMQGFVRKTA